MNDVFRELPRFEKDALLNQRIGFLMSEWFRTFPELNLKHEIQMAHYYMVCHSKKYKRLDVFLSNWMKRADEIRKEKPLFGRLQKYVDPPHTEDMTFEEMRAIRRQNLGTNPMEVIDVTKTPTVGPIQTEWECFVPRPNTKHNSGG